MQKHLMTALGLSVLATSAFSHTAAAAVATAKISAANSQAPDDAEAKKAKAKRHCLKVDLGSGTRVSRPVCKTAQEWADEGVTLKSKQ